MCRSINKKNLFGLKMLWETLPISIVLCHMRPRKQNNFNWNLATVTENRCVDERRFVPLVASRSEDKLVSRCLSIGKLDGKVAGKTTKTLHSLLISQAVKLCKVQILPITLLSVQWSHSRQKSLDKSGLLLRRDGILLLQLCVCRVQTDILRSKKRQVLLPLLWIGRVVCEKACTSIIISSQKSRRDSVRSPPNRRELNGRLTHYENK